MDRTERSASPDPMIYHLTTDSSSLPQGSLNGSSVNTVPAQLSQPTPGPSTPRSTPLSHHSASHHESMSLLDETDRMSEETGSDDPPERSGFPALHIPGVNIARLQREIRLARNQIQSHMDKQYPGKFFLTIPDNNATRVYAEFVAPFGWWEGAYYKIKFDFSLTDKHNAGPEVRVILSPPVAHLCRDRLCFAQLLPNSAHSTYWNGKEESKYSSNNFDRVQQIMNVINFVIMDTDFWDEGEGHRISDIYRSLKITPVPVLSPPYSGPDEKELSDESSTDEFAIKKIAGSTGLDRIRRRISNCIHTVNHKAEDLNPSVSFATSLKEIHRLKSSQLSFQNITPIDFRGYKIYLPEALSECIFAPPIIVEPDGEWENHLATRHHVRIPDNYTEIFNSKYHRADYFYPIRLEPLGIVAEFFTTTDQRFSLTDTNKIRAIPISTENRNSPESDTDSRSLSKSDTDSRSSSKSDTDSRSSSTESEDDPWMQIYYSRHEESDTKTQFVSKYDAESRSSSSSSIPKAKRRRTDYSSDPIVNTKKLFSLHRVLQNSISSITNHSYRLQAIYNSEKRIDTDDELNKVINKLQKDILTKNKNRKKTNKLSCIFIKKTQSINHINTSFRTRRRYRCSSKWKALLKPTKTIAKASNLASQYKLIISRETPNKTLRYRDGRQWGIKANAWLPVVDSDMEDYEKIAAVKLMTDFSHKRLKLPNKREAITARDANNIIMKSMTMTMVNALKDNKKWQPSQCFLDLVINAIITHYEIGELFADIKYHSLKLMTDCLSGKLDRKNLKDFAFLINYLVSAWNQLDEYSDDEKDALRPVLVINAFVEYLVRVLEREFKKNDTFTTPRLDNETELTLDKIIKRSKIGFSVVAHQLTIFDFLLHRSSPLSRLAEQERDQLQFLVKEIQRFLAADNDNNYSQFMKLLFPVSLNWNEPVDFDAPEHQQTILKTVLAKFHERTSGSTHPHPRVSADILTGTDNSKSTSVTFSVSSRVNYEALQTRLHEHLARFKLCKNVPVVEDGITKYQQSCHYCGDSFTTQAPLYETKNPIKIARQKQGFIYRSGLPLHQECKKQRQANTKKALTLLKAMEMNYPPFPPPKNKKE